jgi:CRISPR-associated protein Cas2
MVVMTLERVPPRLRGLLTRWLTEMQSGVYIGRVSAGVRDLLWQRAIDLADGGRVAQAWSAANEQGYAFRIHGDVRRQVIDLDGLTLVALQRGDGS